MTRIPRWYHFAAIAALIALPMPSQANGPRSDRELILDPVVSVTVSNAKMREALISLFDTAHQNYSIDPVVEKGTVSLSVNNATHMLDTPAPKVGLRAEVILLVTDATGHTHRTVLAGFGRTLSEHPMTLSTSIEQLQTTAGVSWKQGQYKIHVEPVVNGDQTVSVEADGELDFIYTLSGRGKPMRLHKEFKGSDRIRAGSTVALTSLTFKTGDHSNSSTGELLVFLTPTLSEAPKPVNQPNGQIPDPSR